LLPWQLKVIFNPSHFLKISSNLIHNIHLIFASFQFKTMTIEQSITLSILPDPELDAAREAKKQVNNS
jgi:hypothetical protein